MMYRAVNNTHSEGGNACGPRDLPAAQVKSINTQKTPEPIVLLPSETEPAKGTEGRPATFLLLLLLLLWPVGGENRAASRSPWASSASPGPAAAPRGGGEKVRAAGIPNSSSLLRG